MTFATRFLYGTLLACVCVRRRACEYPSRAIRILVGFTPGGTTDVIARIVRATGLKID